MCTCHKAQLKKASRHGKVDPKLWAKLNADFEEFNEHGIEPKMPLGIIAGERGGRSLNLGFPAPGEAEG